MCGPRKRHGWRSDRERGTRQERGYGDDWLALRAAHLHANPLCVECEREGRAEAATHVDHVIPFTCLDDPHRLDPANLQSLCEHHHMAKTARQRG